MLAAAWGSVDYWEIAFVLVLILVAALLAASETAISRMGRIRAIRLEEEGRRGSKALVKIAENPAVWRRFSPRPNQRTE